MIRLNRVETTINSLKRGLESYYSELGRATYAVHKQKQLREPSLEALCQRVAEIERDLAAKEAEASSVRTEASPVDEPLRPLFGHVCLKCRVALPSDAVFCPRCGGTATDVPRPGVTTRTCPSCKAEIPVNAQFCPECGHRMGSEQSLEPEQSGAGSKEAEETEPAMPQDLQELIQPAFKTCPACGTQLPPQASFCLGCGSAVNR